MADRRTELVQGIIAHARTRRSQGSSASFAHEYTIGKRVYTLFNEHESSLLKLGDFIRFEHLPKAKPPGRRASYAIDETTIQILDPAERAADTGGYVYVLTNRSMPGLCKIGFTTGVPAERAAELSASTGVPTAFKLEWFTPITGDPQLVEQSVHASLSRKKHGKEFFEIDVERASAAVLQCYRRLYADRACDNTAAILASRRQELEARRQARLREAEEAHRRREYEKSPEYLWLQRGYVRVVEREFPAGFTRSMPGFWNRLTGNMPPAWISIEITGRRGYKRRGEPPWRTAVWGYAGKEIRIVEDHGTYLSARQYADNFLHELRPANIQITISIETELLDQPSIPEGYQLAVEYTGRYRLTLPSMSMIALAE